jgi:TRAP-type mannitol/chloroaromatic compound transport system permease small subunit
VVLLSYVLALGTVGLLFYSVFMNAISAYQSNESIEGTVELPIWPVKFIMVIGLVFFFFQTLVNTIDAAKKLKKNNPTRPVE